MDRRPAFEAIMAGALDGGVGDEKAHDVVDDAPDEGARGGRELADEQVPRPIAHLRATSEACDRQRAGGHQRRPQVR